MYKISHIRLKWHRLFCHPEYPWEIYLYMAFKKLQQINFGSVTRYSGY